MESDSTPREVQEIAKSFRFQARMSVLVCFVGLASLNLRAERLVLCR